MAKETKDQLLALVRDRQPMTGGQQLKLSMLLAIPAILAQISSVLLQYIDAAMVGHLGANPSASIGLISTSTWIFGGFYMAVMSGFSVQIAHRCGAKDFENARGLARQGLFSVFVFTTFLALVALSIARPLPVWLGGGPEITQDATEYFRIYSMFLPIGALGFMASSAMQASGNMKVPSLIYVGMGVLDVMFNYLFIYICDMGVAGAALGTGVAETLASGFAVWYLFFKSGDIALRKDRSTFIPSDKVIRNAFGITGPMWLQNLVMRGAYVMSTVIVAPLGPISIAANSFAITAESFCYMPGQGFSDAATTLVGQSLGADRKDIAKKFAWTCIGLGSAMMTFLAILMYIFAPQMMGILSNDPEVVSLGARMLRIEAFAETMYAVSIVAYGACVGAGDTMVPTVMNFVSMWLVRIGLSLILTPRLGLQGYWIAMCVELNFRGLLFLLHMRRNRWKKIAIT